MLLLNCTILENNQIFWVKKLPPHVLDKFKNQKSISGVSSPEKLFLFRQPGDLLYNTFICLLLIHTAHVGQTVPNVHLKCQERMALHVIYGTIWLCCRTTSNDMMTTSNDMMTAMKYWENISRVGKYWENTGVQIQELKGVGMLAGEGSWRGDQSRTGSSTT